jgi:hypothetical protein
MDMTQLSAFFALCVAIVYFGNCVFAKRLIRIEPKMAALYVSTLALIGIYGEIFVNKLYDVLFGHPLWTYRIEPIHGGLSSKYAFFLWGIYGLHIYLLHGALKGRRINSKKYMTYIFGFEGVAIEFITNSLFLIIFNRYLFYYPANDLWHITSLQGIPCYIAGGWVISKSLERFKQDPKFFIVMNLLLTSVIVFFV